MEIKLGKVFRKNKCVCQIILRHEIDKKIAAVFFVTFNGTI